MMVKSGQDFFLITPCASLSPGFLIKSKISVIKITWYGHGGIFKKKILAKDK